MTKVIGDTVRRSFGSLVMFLAVDTTFGAKMPIKSVHASECLLATFARVRADVQVKCLMALAVMLSRKALLASRPLALERAFLIVGPKMTSKIEMPRESTSAAGHGAGKASLGSPSIG